MAPGPSRFGGSRLWVVSDFEPTTDFPDAIDVDDDAVASTAKSRDEALQRRRRNVVRWLSIGAALALMAVGYSWWRVVVAVGVGYGLLMTGVAIIGAFARPIPEPPPAGELRRVKLTYRCGSCGTELRMTLANDQVPTPPRHCADEMELTTSVEDIL